MSFFSKARGILNKPIGDLFEKAPAKPEKIHVDDIPEKIHVDDIPVFVATSRHRKRRRREDKIYHGRGARRPDGTRHTVRWPANGVKP